MRPTQTIAIGSTSKRERYAALAEAVVAVLHGEANQIARMATVAAMLAESFEEFLWTGFYLVEESGADELVIGPYQGKLGCLRIPFGRGVCGAAAATRKTVVVDDVDAFPGHIACDSRARSEVVVPVFGLADALIAVLDVDSAAVAAFDQDDVIGLETIVGRAFTPARQALTSVAAK